MTTQTYVTTAIVVRDAEALPWADTKRGTQLLWLTPDTFIELSASLSSTEKASWLRDTADRFAELATALEDGEVPC